MARHVLVRRVGPRGIVLPPLIWRQDWRTLVRANYQTAIFGSGAPNTPYPNTIGGPTPAWANATAYAVDQCIRGTGPGAGTNCYRCIAPHVSDPTTQPITGANWATVWERYYLAQTVDAAAEGLADWPSAAALRINFGNSRDAVQNINTLVGSIIPGVVALNSPLVYGPSWTTPAVGESLYFRVVHRIVFPGVVGNNNHSWEERAGSGTNWSWVFRTTATGFVPVFNVWVAPGTATRFPLNVELARNTAYYFEHSVDRVSPTQRQHRIRVSDANYNLLATEAAFFNEVGPFQSLAGFTQLYNTLLGPPSGVDAVGFHELGTNGPNIPGLLTSDSPAWYFGCAAVSRVGFPGRYTLARG